MLFVFNELLEAAQSPRDGSDLAYMIDQSHNVTDTIESMLSSAEATTGCYAKALLVDRDELHEAQNDNDVMRAFRTLRGAYDTDVWPILAKAPAELGGVDRLVQSVSRQPLPRPQDAKAQSRKGIGLGAGIV